MGVKFLVAEPVSRQERVLKQLGECLPTKPVTERNFVFWTDTLWFMGLKNLWLKPG